jgi:A/G-specific adenine glycosylase
MKRHRRARFGHRTILESKVHYLRRSVLRWWRFSKRKFPWRQSNASRYYQIVSEVLLQRTRAETVAAYWPYFVSRFPNWKAVATSTVNKIETALRPIGLAKQRAPRFHSLAKEIASRAGRFPAQRDEIEQLPGVGQYIANAVLMFCHGISLPLLDTNMARVIERYFGARKLADIRYDPYLQRLSRHIVNHEKGKDLNWAILDFSAIVCKPSNPQCSDCPLARKCLYFKSRYSKRTERS